ncbi:MAG: hypothetical protein KDC07_12045 [Chitinophagaceae bacterium]|nr:hypothetical protein [Chitinophagaceae bacterium]MCB9045772.1 hypothetical protein [Chitinophagales bacterium]
MTKEKVLDVIKDMPKDFQLDELIERLMFIEKVEEGIRQVNEGQAVSHEDVKKIVSEWRR